MLLRTKFCTDLASSPELWISTSGAKFKFVRWNVINDALVCRHFYYIFSFLVHIPEVAVAPIFVFLFPAEWSVLSEALLHLFLLFSHIPLYHCFIPASCRMVGSRQALPLYSSLYYNSERGHVNIFWNGFRLSRVAVSGRFDQLFANTTTSNSS